MLVNFGAGDIFAKLVQDAYGNAISNPTPIRIGGAQEFSLDFAGDLKEFYGQGRYALLVAQAKVKTTGKMQGALMNGLALNTLFFGLGVTSGTMKAINADTTGTVVPATPFTITPTVPNTGTWVEDLGVQNDQGDTLVRVATAPATGQYSVAAGVYTFAAADTGVRMYISFTYTYTLAKAKKISLLNLPQGYAPLFSIYYQGSFQGKKSLAYLAAVTAPKLTMFSSKNDDFSVPSLDFSAQTDASGYNIGELYVQE